MLSTKNVIKATMALSLIHAFNQQATAMPTPDDLGQAWVKAIEAREPDKLVALAHPGCSRAMADERTLAKLAGGALPENYHVKVTPLTASVATLNRNYAVLPTHQLDIVYDTKTPQERAKYGAGKSLPIAEQNGQWYLVLCPRR